MVNPTGTPTQQRLTTAEKRAEALEMRKAGHTYDAIGKAMGWAAPTAYRHVKAAILAITAEPAKEVLQMELDRLDAMLLGLYERATEGDLKAVDRALRIMARRAAYLGLDAQAGPGEVSEVSAWLLSMGAKPAALAAPPDDDDDDGVDPLS